MSSWESNIELWIWSGELMSLILNCGCGPVSSWESNIELLTLSGELMGV